VEISHRKDDNRREDIARVEQRLEIIEIDGRLADAKTHGLENQQKIKGKANY
jgi:hypothetical protein